MMIRDLDYTGGYHLDDYRTEVAEREVINDLAFLENWINEKEQKHFDIHVRILIRFHTWNELKSI